MKSCRFTQAIFVGNLIVLFLITLSLLKTAVPKTEGTISWGDIGSLLAGVAAVPGIFFLIRTFYLQIQQKRESDLEKAFTIRCDSIDVGLDYIKSDDGNHDGGAAIHHYGVMCANGKINTEELLNHLNADALKSVVAGLIELAKWLTEDKLNLAFHPFFRVRYMSVIMSLENMMPSTAHEMRQNELFAVYGTTKAYSLFLSIKELAKLEFESWALNQELQEVAPPQKAQPIIIKNSADSGLPSLDLPTMRKWIIETEHKDYFILRDPDGNQVLNLPRVIFESQKEYQGATRDGNTLTIPVVPTIKRKH